MFAFSQDVPIDRDMYARIMAGVGDEPIAGQVIHLCIELEGGGLRYIDVWESQQAYETAVHERIHPAVAAALGSARPSSEPSSTPLTVIDVRGNAVATAV
jgi:hypothetical protein